MLGTMIDTQIQNAYRAAHLVLRSYWFVRRPHTSGALAAVWHEGRLLLVKSSYRRHYSLPGGYVRPGEDPRAAASRELREEVGLLVPFERFEHAWHGTKSFEFRRDTLDIFEVTLDRAPEVRIDRREIVWADWKTPDEARAMGIVPHLEEYLEDRS